MSALALLCCLVGLHRWEDGARTVDGLGRVTVERTCAVCGLGGQLVVYSDAAAHLDPPVPPPPGPVAFHPTPPATVPEEDAPDLDMEALMARLRAHGERSRHQRQPQVGYQPRGLRRTFWGPRAAQRIEALQAQMRPEDVARTVMEESVGRSEPLTPRVWAVQGRGPTQGDRAGRVTPAAKAG